MAAGIWNLVFGGVMLVGGLSGKLVFVGTNSSTLLAVLGGCLMAYGGYQIKQSKSS